MPFEWEPWCAAGRPAGWRVLADRARLGRPGSRMPLRCALPLQAWVGHIVAVARLQLVEFATSEAYVCFSVSDGTGVIISRYIEAFSDPFACSAATIVYCSGGGKSIANPKHTDCIFISACGEQRRRVGVSLECTCKTL